MAPSLLGLLPFWGVLAPESGIEYSSSFDEDMGDDRASGTVSKDEPTEETTEALSAGGGDGDEGEDGSHVVGLDSSTEFDGADGEEEEEEKNRPKNPLINPIGKFAVAAVLQTKTQRRAKSVEQKTNINHRKLNINGRKLSWKLGTVFIRHKLIKDPATRQNVK